MAEVVLSMHSSGSDCLAIIKYIRDKVASATTLEEALEYIDEIIEALEQEHIAEVIARLEICNKY